jgi:hypothetical protein
MTGLVVLALAALGAAPAMATYYDYSGNYGCGLECGKSALPGTTYYEQSNGNMSVRRPQAEVVSHPLRNTDTGGH